jgi:hypothetical protein
VLKISAFGNTQTVGSNFKPHPNSFKFFMDISDIQKTSIEDKDQHFYYHPLYTTLAFLITLPYYFGFGTLFYFCWTTNKTNLLFGFLAAFILLSNPFLLIANAFVKLLFRQPAIVLTEKYLFDNWNNLKLNWADIKQIGSFNFRWSFICINTTKDNIVFSQILNPSKFLFMGLERLFSGRTLKINLSLLKDNNSYIVSTTKQFWRTKTATNIGIAASGAGR